MLPDVVRIKPSLVFHKRSQRRYHNNNTGTMRNFEQRVRCDRKALGNQRSAETCRQIHEYTMTPRNFLRVFMFRYKMINCKLFFYSFQRSLLTAFRNLRLFFFFTGKTKKDCLRDRSRWKGKYENQSIRNESTNPCKPAGCQNKLLGAVAQTYYTEDFVTCQRRLCPLYWDNIIVISLRKLDSTPLINSRCVSILKCILLGRASVFISSYVRLIIP